MLRLVSRPEIVSRWPKLLSTVRRGHNSGTVDSAWTFSVRRVRTDSHNSAGLHSVQSIQNL
jgi:hypothetical protein